jgi:hypothetical protein
MHTNTFQNYFFPMPPHVHIDLLGPPSWLWPKCNQLLRLGRPQVAVTLSRWCEWRWCEWWWCEWRWYMWAWSTRRVLKPKFYKLPRPWSLWGSSTARVNSHGRTGSRTRDLMVSSQKFCPPSHEAGPFRNFKTVYSHQQNKSNSNK